MLLLTILLFLLKYSSLAHGDDPEGNDMDDLTAAQIIELRKFSAKEHLITTEDGYMLTLVEARNPLFNGQEPTNCVVLMIHGIRSSAKDFIRNSIDARPKDYSKLNVTNSTIEQLIELTKNDPAKESLAFTLLNFGCRVWLLNRRGSTESRRHKVFNESDINPVNSIRKRHHSKMQQVLNAIGNKTIGNDLSLSMWKHTQNKDLGFLLSGLVGYFELPSIDSGWNPIRNMAYWNYSMDEQVAHDLPQVITYCLNQTKQEKLILIGHSAGGALILMTLASNQEVAKKVSKAMLWAPAINLGGRDPHPSMLYKVGAYLFARYSAPSPYVSTVPMIKRTIHELCSTPLGQATVCQSAYSQMYGPCMGQMNLKPGIIKAGVDIVSSHEYAQLIRSLIEGITRQFNYESAVKNMIAYGSSEPPIYDLSKVKHDKISLWWGNTDINVPPEAIEETLRQLSSGKLDIEMELELKLRIARQSS